MDRHVNPAAHSPSPFSPHSEFPFEQTPHSHLDKHSLSLEHSVPCGDGPNACPHASVENPRTIETIKEYCRVVLDMVASV